MLHVLYNLRLLFEQALLLPLLSVQLLLDLCVHQVWMLMLLLFLLLGGLLQSM